MKRNLLPSLPVKKIPNRRQGLLSPQQILPLDFSSLNEDYSKNELSNAQQIAGGVQDTLLKSVGLVTALEGLGLITLTKTTAGAATALTATGVGVVVAVALVAVGAVLSKYVLDKCRKSTWDSGEANAKANIMKGFYSQSLGRLGYQTSINQYQDEKVVVAINEALTMALYYEMRVFREVKGNDWDSCSRDNLYNLYNFTEKIKNNIYSKIEDYKQIYDIEFYEAEIDLSIIANNYQWSWHSKHNPKITARYVASMERKQGFEETFVFFGDFAKVDEPTASVLNRSLADTTTRQQMDTFGKQLNATYTGKGYAPIIDPTTGNVVGVTPINQDDKARADAENTGLTISAVDVEKLHRFTRNYYNKLINLTQYKGILDKYPDRMLMEAMQAVPYSKNGGDAGFAFSWFRDRKEFLCFLKQNRTALYHQLAELARKSPVWVNNEYQQRLIDNPCPDTMPPSVPVQNIPIPPSSGTIQNPPSGNNSSSGTIPNHPSWNNPSSGTIPNHPSGNNSSSGTTPNHSSENNPSSGIPNSNSGMNNPVEISKEIGGKKVKKSSFGWLWLAVIAGTIYYTAKKKKKDKK